MTLFATESPTGGQGGAAVVARAAWAFADCRTAPYPRVVHLTRGVPDPTRICVKDGCDPAKLYDLVYTAKDPLVLRRDGPGQFCGQALPKEQSQGPSHAHFSMTDRWRIVPAAQVGSPTPLAVARETRYPAHRGLNKRLPMIAARCAGERTTGTGAMEREGATRL